MNPPSAGNWKLTVGKLLAAWRDYPRQRREIGQCPPGRPIFITGTHRSGTTWVGRMLAVPGVWHVHEPFCPAQNLWREEFTYVPPGGTAAPVNRLMRRVLAGRARSALKLPNADHRLMPLRLFPQPVQRILIKDPLACLLTGYLTERFNLQTLVLFRHPCGFVSSVCRLGWPRARFLRDFLEHRELMSDHLAPWADLMRRHSQADSLAGAAVLHGVLNQVLWNQAQQLGLRWCRFEDLCDDPLASFAELFDWFGLPYDESTRRFHESLCFAETRSVQEYHPHAVRRNSRSMADSWRQQLSADEVAEVRGIWEQFDVPLYESSHDWILVNQHDYCTERTI